MNTEDLNDLKQLIEFLKQYQVAEFDLDRGDLKIRLKFEAQPQGASLAGLANQARIAPTRAANVAAPAQPAVEPAGDAVSEDLHIVKSPIVGTFFSAPSPGAKPFVAVGERVEAGQTLCIIEAMKLMNEIEADAAGEVVKFLVEDGQAVEYGQPLFALKA
jgi:acetyl-CoA carboxylase biotin carboxyl carrier protein